MRTIELSAFDTLPCVSFVNTTSGQRHVLIFETGQAARDAAEELRELSHIEQVELHDASVKSGSRRRQGAIGAPCRAERISGVCVVHPRGCP